MMQSAHKHKWVPIPGLKAFPQRLCRCGAILSSSVQAGRNSITLSPVGGGDVIQWTTTQGAVVKGDIGMRLLTGRGSFRIDGPARGIGLASEIPAAKVIEVQQNPNATTISTKGGAPAPTVAGTPTVLDNTVGQFINYATAAVINSDGGWIAPSFDQIQRQHHGRFEAFVFVGGSIASMRIWVGLFSASPMGSANPAGHFAGLRYDTGAGDTTWRFATKDGATLNLDATTFPIAVQTGYYIRIFFDQESFQAAISIGTLGAGGITPTTVLTSLNLPGSTQNLGYCLQMRTLNATAKNFGVSTAGIWQHPVLL